MDTAFLFWTEDHNVNRIYTNLRSSIFHSESETSQVRIIVISLSGFVTVGKQLWLKNSYPQGLQLFDMSPMNANVFKTTEGTLPAWVTHISNYISSIIFFIALEHPKGGRN